VLGVVRLAGDGDDAARGKRGGGLFERFGLACGQADTCAFRDEAFRDGKPDAPTRR
jgi:hypothetical protein